MSLDELTQTSLFGDGALTALFTAGVMVGSKVMVRQMLRFPFGPWQLTRANSQRDV
jgi:hypothetical protein